jgi:glycerophosphoryl diester phosphodiesterase
LSEELTDVEALTNIATIEQEQTEEEEASTFEDLLENYSNFNIGSNALTKSPNYLSTEPSTRDSSPEEKFEVVSGNSVKSPNLR